MKLVTKELEKTFEKYPIGSQDGKMENAEVLAKYFNPMGSGTWLVTEAEKQDDDWLFFGYCHITDWEWGYFSLKELESVKLPFGLGIERDLYTGNQKYIKDYVDIGYTKNDEMDI